MNQTEQKNTSIIPTWLKLCDSWSFRMNADEKAFSFSYQHLKVPKLTSEISGKKREIKFFYS